MICPTPAFNRTPKPRRFAGLTVKHIRTFATFEAASRYIDMRLAQRPCFMFNIQQTQSGWIVSRVIGA